MKNLLFSIALLVGASSYAQQTKTAAELNAEKAKLQSEVKALKGKIGSIDGQLAKYNRGWKFGTMGTIGAALSGYSNWFANPVRNSENGNIAVVLNGFANLKEDQYFWKNTGTINLGWTKIVDLDNKNLSDEQKEYTLTSDILNITSLFGYNLTKEFAISSLAEYRSTMIKKFNNPGFLDFGVGATWTPMPELLVVLHPLNYNFVFSSDEAAKFESSLGCKFMAEYKKDFEYLKFRSNLTGFVSYTDISNLSNWTWVNSLGFNIWKGIGVGIEGGLRQNKQEAFNAKYKNPSTLNAAENPIQSYWLVGLNYSM